MFSSLLIVLFIQRATLIA